MSNAGDGATGPDPPPRALPGGRLVATVVQGHTFSVDRRYEPKKILGKGSFGVVCTAFDSVRGENIAIKRIRPFANDEWDARHTLREIRLMKILGKHPNVRRQRIFKVLSTLFNLIVDRIVASYSFSGHHSVRPESLRREVRALHDDGGAQP